MNDKLKNIVIIVMAIIILLLGGYLVYDKIMNKEENDKLQQNQQEEKENTDNCAKTAAPKCYGTYYKEVSGTYENGISYNYKTTYVLKEDGTFTADFGGVSGTQGTFVINDNTISLTGIKDVAGPRDQDTHYSTVDYIIADDCSYILIDFQTNDKLLKQ